MLARGASGSSGERAKTRSSAGGERLAWTGSSTRTPVSPSTTVSARAAFRSATTGRPHAWASTGTMPKSSTPGQQGRGRRSIQRRESPRSSASRGTARPAPAAALQAAQLGAGADDRQRLAEHPRGVDGRSRGACRARGRTRREGLRERGGDRPEDDKRLCLQEDTRRSTRDYSIGGSAPQHSANWRRSGRPGPPSPDPIAPCPAMTGLSSPVAAAARPAPAPKYASN